MAESATLNTRMELTATIVAAYVSHNTIQASQLGHLIDEVSAALLKLAHPSAGTAAPSNEPVPAVSIRKSVHPDYIVCLEDGKKFKSLRRHLTTFYSMTPEEYREKWGLPKDYPMVAANYSRQRSDLAKTMGLGQVRSKPLRKVPRKKAPVAA